MKREFLLYPISVFWLYATLGMLGKAAVPVSLVKPGASGSLLARSCQLGPESPEIAPAWLHLPAAIRKGVGQG